MGSPTENQRYLCRHCHTLIATRGDVFLQSSHWLYSKRVVNMELIAEPVCISHGKLMGSLICSHCKLARGLGCFSSNPGRGNYFLLLKDQLLVRIGNFPYERTMKFVVFTPKSPEAFGPDTVNREEENNEVQIANSDIKSSTDEPENVPSESETGTEKEINIQFLGEEKEIPRAEIQILCRHCCSHIATLDDQIGTAGILALLSRVINMDVSGEPLCIFHGRLLGSLICRKCKLAKGLGFLNPEPGQCNYFMLIEAQLLQRHGNILCNAATGEFVADLSPRSVEASATVAAIEAEAKIELQIEDRETGIANSDIKQATEEPKKAPNESETGVANGTSNSGAASRKGNGRKRKGKKRRA